MGLSAGFCSSASSVVRLCVAFGLLVAWHALEFSSIMCPNWWGLPEHCSPRQPAQPQPALPAREWGAGHPLPSCSHSAAAPHLFSGVSHRSPKAGSVPPLVVRVLCFMGASGCCVYGGTRHLCGAPAPMFAPWYCPLGGTRRGQGPTCPCRQGCAGCHAPHFAADRGHERASVQLSLLVRLQAEWCKWGAWVPALEAARCLLP